MSSTKKWFLASVLLATVVFVAAAAADHGGDRGRGERHGHNALLHQRLVGSILSDPPIHGVVRGGLPWQGGGDASLDRKGRFEARIRGLVIPAMGNPGPVTTITISLYCAPDSGTAAAFTADPVSLSAQATRVSVST